MVALIERTYAWNDPQRANMIKKTIHMMRQHLVSAGAKEELTPSICQDMVFCLTESLHTDNHKLPASMNPYGLYDVILGVADTAPNPREHAMFLVCMHQYMSMLLYAPVVEPL